MNALKSILRGILKTLEGDGDKLLEGKQLLSCEVCCEVYKDQNPFCIKCFVCYSCLDKWFSQQIKDQIGNPSCELINLKIFCPSCMKNIRLTEIKKKQNIFSNSLNNLTEFYLRRDESYISCPSPNCKNIGWIDNKTCRKYFNCTFCNYRWSNPYKISFMNMIANKFCPQDIKSRLYKSLFTKSCPNCKSRISKYGGCRELTCSQCKHSFCWNCKSQPHQDFNLICFTICFLWSLLLLIPLNMILWSFGFYIWLSKPAFLLFQDDILDWATLYFIQFIHKKEEDTNYFYDC